MLVPDEIRQCITFIGYRDAAGDPQLAGTAFFIASELDDLGLSDQGAVFLVTAQHVIDTIIAHGGRGALRLNMVGGSAKWLEISASAFYSHPNHPHTEAVDVAVAPVSPPDIVEYMAIPSRMWLNKSLVQKNKIGTGDEVFVTGLFWNHHGKERNLPIVRVGNIAGMPEEKVRSRIGDIDAYLVEARSIGGLSGSPVFVHLGLTRSFDGKVQFAQNTDTGIYYLLGVMQGHWDSNSMLSVDELPADDALRQERLNMGIAIVTPIEKVIETMERPELKAHRERVAEITRKKQEGELPVSDTLSSADDPNFTKDDFEKALNKVARKLPDSGKPQT